MATDRAFGEQLLDRMSASGLPYCILHGVSAEALQSSGDIDIAVAQPVRGLIHDLSDIFSGLGTIVCAWHYDSASWSVFILGNQFGERAQLDLTFDPRGGGTYGVKTGPVIEACEIQRWPVTTEVDRALYRLSKALRKDRRDEASSLIAQSQRELTERGRQILGSGQQGMRVRAVLETGSAAAYRVPHRSLALNIPRMLGRISHPCGVRLRTGSEQPATPRSIHELLVDLEALLPAGRSHIGTYRELATLRRTVLPSLLTVSRDFSWVPTHSDLESQDRDSALRAIGRRFNR